jgi:SAM-dependent methyltransferase
MDPPPGADTLARPAPEDRIMTVDLIAELGIDELRGAFLRYTEAAFRLLPRDRVGAILEIGCGRGACLLHLARISRAVLVGVDVDETALHRARAVLDAAALADRISLWHASLLDAPLPEQGFDVVWEEGVLHLLPLGPALDRCRSLLRPGGFLVSAETVRWHSGHHGTFARTGFSELGRVTWEPRCWWTEYYRPLRARVEALRATLPRKTAGQLRPYEAEIAAAAGDPAATNCAHVVFTTAREPSGGP